MIEKRKNCECRKYSLLSDDVNLVSITKSGDDFDLNLNNITKGGRSLINYEINNYTFRLIFISFSEIEVNLLKKELLNNNDKLDFKLFYAICSKYIKVENCKYYYIAALKNDKPIGEMEIINQKTNKFFIT